MSDGRKLVYCFHPETREYTGNDYAFECQIEPGVWHIPAGATELEPPHAPAGKTIVFTTDRWVVVDKSTVPSVP